MRTWWMNVTANVRSVCLCYSQSRGAYWSATWPYDEIAGVDEAAVVGALQVPRVAHHGAGPAALGAGVHVEHLIWDDLEQLLHHSSEIGRMLLWLQPLVTQQRRGSEERGKERERWGERERESHGSGATLSRSDWTRAAELETPSTFLK